MGYKNAVAVLALWPKLDPLPKLLLLAMALRSIDPPGRKRGRPPCVYFGGEEDLVEISQRSRGQTYAALRALRDARAIEVVHGGAPGRRAVYRINVDAFDMPDQDGD